MNIFQSDPILAGASIVAALLLLVLLIQVFRRKPIERPDSDADSRDELHRSILQTLKLYRKEHAAFVQVVESLLADLSLQDLLDNDEVEIALGKLSYLGEKSRKAKQRASSLLTMADDAPEVRAAMVTIVRACCLSEDFSQRLRPETRDHIDRFLERI